MAAQDYLPRLKRRFPLGLAILGMIAMAYGCSKHEEPHAPVQVAQPDATHPFEEGAKTGELSFAIIGDYFNHNYVLELARLAQTLSPGSKQIFYCSPAFEKALDPLLAANHIENVETEPLTHPSLLLTQWARDIFVAGTAGEHKLIIASPYKNARSPQEASQIGAFLMQALPGYAVQVAPFVFEGGNLAFVAARGKRYLFVGKKVIWDNEVYQKQPWAAHYDEAALRQALAKTFVVDSVVVMGRAKIRPPERMYFEYHLDMGMVILKDDRAVVSQLAFGDPEKRMLANAVKHTYHVITPFASVPKDSLYGQLCDRLASVSQEYNDYAATLGGLGLKVYRSPVDWRHVLGSMSWTNVVQAGDRILMPVYPDSLRGFTKDVDHVDGQMKITLDVSDLKHETFDSHLNETNKELYESLGYEVIEVPEYLHYMMGGLHCFVNVVE
jgi:N-dimethylarginine dimethylaminohydrolase